MIEDRNESEERSREMEMQDRRFWDGLDKRQKIDLMAFDYRIEEICRWHDERELGQNE